MVQNPKKIVAVLSDLEMAEKTLSIAFTFADAHDAIIEVIYVHEPALFETPDYFLSDIKMEEDSLDKNHIKLEIQKRIKYLDNSRPCALFTFIGDTVNRVKHLVKSDKDILIITAYHDKITKSLLSKVTQPVLILKGKRSHYRNIALSVNLDEYTMDCIQLASHVFDKQNLYLLYDYRYVIDSSMELDLQNLTLIEEGQKSAFETLKKKSTLDGKFFSDSSFLGDAFIEYIYTKNFDLVICCLNRDDFFISTSLPAKLLEDAGITCDIFVATET